MMSKQNAGSRSIPAMIKTVFFDMGDTILHETNIPGLDERSARRVAEVLSRCNYEVNILDIPKAYDEARRLVRNRYAPKLLEMDLVEAWQEVLKNLGVPPERMLAKECMDAWYSARQGIGWLEYYEDFMPVQKELRRLGLKLGLISNATYGIMYFVDELRLADYFDTLVFSWEVKYVKPHPRIFEIALKRLKVSPEESIMVGDSLKSDVAGAKSMGMTAIWIDRGKQGVTFMNYNVKPDYVIHDLRELIPLLDIISEEKKRIRR